MRRITAALLLAVVVLAAAMAAGLAQTETPPCVSKLLPCAQYLNSTAKPPDTCCGPIKKAVKDERPCLCSLLDNPTLLKAFGIDIDKVLRLPKACGVNANSTTICSSSGGSTTAASPSSSTGSPPAIQGTNATNNTNSAHGVAWIGMSGLASLFFFCWSIVA